MQYQRFRIKNFKGIDDLTFTFDTKPNTQIITLIGLNESGKTTILEAINSFKFKPESLAALQITGYEIDDIHDLIPISKRTNFSDTVTVYAELKLSPKDKEDLNELLKTLKLELKSPIEVVMFGNEYQFTDSKFTKRTNWVKIPDVKKGRSRKYVKFHSLKLEWSELIGWLNARVPSITYFPNFLFNFPDRIFLEQTSVDERKHAFYRKLVQKMLVAMDPSLDLQKHIVDRANSGDKHDERALNALILKLQEQVSKTVFEAWDRVLNKRQSGKEVVFKVAKDDGSLYLEINIKDGSNLFYVGERSLGFRWFFAFLLMTQYAPGDSNTSKEQLFLFDEPASNLHSSAQKQLMESFARFPSGSKVLFTTHSHYMVNPLWLESAYVVKNEGIDYNSPNDDYVAKASRIVVDRYRTFAVKHPDQTTYYQPILDVLDYKPSNIELALDAIFLEGKNDSYILRLAAMQEGLDIKNKCLIPGTGSGNLEALVRLYLGWGRKFVVLLDADRAGLSEMKRYLTLFGAALEDRIYTLSDVDSRWTDKSMEDLVPMSERVSLQMSSYPEGNSTYDKSLFNRAIQELASKGPGSYLAAETAADLCSVLSFCCLKLDLQ